MRSTDGDGKRIHSGLRGEFVRLFNIGQRGFIALRNMPDLSFDGSAERLGVFHTEMSDTDILFKRQTGTVVHHRRISPGERILDLPDVVAVVQMKRDRLIAAVRHADQRSRKVKRLCRIKQPHIQLNDDR